MTPYTDVALEDLFDLVQGRPDHTLAAIESNPGPYPVYSASLLKPFGFIATFDHEGPALTWVMNGYGGRMQEVGGPFSATRDRGVLRPLAHTTTPDLTYVRFAAEPQLVAAAVGRVVDGRLNNYTKVYPEDAGKVTFPVPIRPDGTFDYGAMTAFGAKLRRIEQARFHVASTMEQFSRAALSVPTPSAEKLVRLDDPSLFRLEIGDRVLRTALTPNGIPVYSANPLVPFGFVEASNLTDFTKPSVLWGIDGNFDFNFIAKSQPFATTDHCGRLQVIDDQLDPFFVFWALKRSRARYGFDRVYRASLANIKADVEIAVPWDERSGSFDVERQRAIAERMQALENARMDVLSRAGELLHARVRIEELSI